MVSGPSSTAPVRVPLISSSTSPLARGVGLQQQPPFAAGLPGAPSAGDKTPFGGASASVTPRAGQSQYHYNPHASQPQHALALLQQHQARYAAEFPPYGGVRRFVPQLPNVNDLVIDYMTHGNDYDPLTVERAVMEANVLFDRGEYLRALNYFAVAYELFRFLPDRDRYFPLAHDVLLRRVICLSILGRFEQALEECGMLLTVSPNSPAAFFFQGILFSKTNDTGNANAAFQRCVSQNPDYHSLIDVLVGIFLHMGAYFDHAIAVAGKVLQRESGVGDARLEALALILRADSYKFHNDGYYAVQAADDYCTLFTKGAEYRRYMGQGFAFKNHDLIENRYIREFSDVFENTRPRGFYEYPLFNLVRNCNVRPLNVVGLVLLCAAKFLVRNRSTRVLKRLEREQDALEQKRSSVEAELLALNASEPLDVKALMQKRRTKGSAEDRFQLRPGDDGLVVWGPADADLIHVKPYRRYWCERPAKAPKVILDDGRVVSEKAAEEIKETRAEADARKRSKSTSPGRGGGKAKKPPFTELYPAEVKEEDLERQRKKKEGSQEYDFEGDMNKELDEFVKQKKLGLEGVWIEGEHEAVPIVPAASRGSVRKHASRSSLLSARRGGDDDTTRSNANAFHFEFDGPEKLAAPNRTAGAAADGTAVENPSANTSDGSEGDAGAAEEEGRGAAAGAGTGSTSTRSRSSRSSRSRTPSSCSSRSSSIAPGPSPRRGASENSSSPDACERLDDDITSMLLCCHDDPPTPSESSTKYSDRTGRDTCTGGGSGAQHRGRGRGRRAREKLPPALAISSGAWAHYGAGAEGANGGSSARRNSESDLHGRTARSCSSTASGSAAGRRGPPGITGAMRAAGGKLMNVNWKRSRRLSRSGLKVAERRASCTTDTSASTCDGSPLLRLPIDLIRTPAPSMSRNPASRRDSECDGLEDSCRRTRSFSASSSSKRLVMPSEQEVQDEHDSSAASFDIARRDAADVEEQCAMAIYPGVMCLFEGAHDAAPAKGGGDGTNTAGVQELPANDAAAASASAVEVEQGSMPQAPLNSAAVEHEPPPASSQERSGLCPPAAGAKEDTTAVGIPPATSGGGPEEAIYTGRAQHGLEPDKLNETVWGDEQTGFFPEGALNVTGAGLREKAIAQQCDYFDRGGMDQLFDQHPMPQNAPPLPDTTAPLSDLDANQQLALRLALERPVAVQALPPATGTDWTEDEWSRRALLAADEYIESEGLSPVKERLPPQRHASINAHLSGRATYEGDDVVDVVVHHGLGAIQDFYGELDSVAEMTSTVLFSENPENTVGTFSALEPRSYVLPPSSSTRSRSAGAAKYGIGTSDIRQHVHRQFQGRILRQGA